MARIKEPTWKRSRRLGFSILENGKEFTSFPIIVDPSHGTGIKELILPMSKAAIAIGCDGLIIEVHPNPSIAYSDSEQSLSIEEFKKIYVQLQNLWRKL